MDLSSTAMQHAEGQPTLIDAEKVLAWVGQFDSMDRRTAILLYESLILVRSTEYEAVMSRLLQEHIASTGHSVALFAIREIKGGRYFHDTDPDARPYAVDAGAGVGSEGPTAHLIRDLAKKVGPRALDHPSISMMKNCKCREIVLVEDIAGTGGHAAKFVKAMYAHGTIKSWASLGYVHFTVLVYAKTRQAERRIMSLPNVTALVAERDLEPGRATWSEEQEQRIYGLCSRYANRTSRPWIPFGLGKAFTCIVFQHKCPNTVPPILWAGSKNWMPLFNTRPSLDFPVWPEQVSAEEQRRRILKAMGQERLSDADIGKFITSQGVVRLMALAAAAKRITRLPVLADILGIGASLAKQTLEECVAYGWLTWERDLTPAGQAVLDHARRLGVLKAEDAPWSDSFYFPKMLRGARSSSSAGR